MCVCSEILGNKCQGMAMRHALFGFRILREKIKHFQPPKKMCKLSSKGMLFSFAILKIFEKTFAQAESATFRKSSKIGTPQASQKSKNHHALIKLSTDVFDVDSGREDLLSSSATVLILQGPQRDHVASQMKCNLVVPLGTIVLRYGFLASTHARRDRPRDLNLKSSALRDFLR